MGAKPKDRWSHWPGPHTRADRAVLDSIGFVQFPFITLSVNVGVLALSVGVLWGTWNPLGCAFFSVAAGAYAVWLGSKGWTPWRMGAYRAFGDGDSQKWDRNPTATRVYEFLHMPRIRWTAAAICGTATLTPWIITIVSRVAGGHPLARGGRAIVISPLGLAIFGYFDAIRSGNLACVWMARELRRNWASLHENAVSGEAAEPHVMAETSEDSESSDPLDILLRRRGISRSQALVWFLIILIVGSLLAYLRGRAKRLGY